jgi:signal transduction histidine kinase
MSATKSARLLKALVEIGQELASTTDLEELLAHLLDVSREVFRFENAIIRLLDDQTGELVAVASFGYADDAVRRSIRVGQGVMGKAAAACEPVLVEDVRALPDYVPGIPGAVSELAVPLVCRDQLVGVLNVESPHAGAFSRDDIEPLLTLGRQAAIAIANARLIQELRTLSANQQKLFDQALQREKLAELGRLVAGIAHEINNPLAIIAYAMELLRREAELQPFQEEMAEKIELEVERLKTLTGGLLAFSSTRDGHRRLVALNDLVDEVLHLLRFELQRQGVRLVTEFAELPLIPADTGKLKQVVINLVTNAAQAIAGEGTVTLRTLRHGDNAIELSVSDTGPGICEELHENIFAPFFTTKSEGEGTGLGLYLCRNIVREHGGEILLDSTPGNGAIFRVQLPVS